VINGHILYRFKDKKSADKIINVLISQPSNMQKEMGLYQIGKQNKYISWVVIMELCQPP
jgi:hypothetical protein